MISHLQNQLSLKSNIITPTPQCAYDNEIFHSFEYELENNEEITQINAELDCKLVSENFTNNYIVQAGSKITKKWCL